MRIPIILLLLIPFASAETLNLHFLYNDSCSYALKISSSADVISDGSIKFYHNIMPKASNFTIEYWIEDLEGNIVKEKINTTNTNEKSYTPKGAEKAYLIKSTLKVGCNEKDLSDNYAEKMFVFKGSGESSADEKSDTEETVNAASTKSSDSTKTAAKNATKSNYTEYKVPASNNNSTEVIQSDSWWKKSYISYGFIGLLTVICAILILKR